MSTGQSPGGKFTGSTSEKSALKLLMPLALADMRVCAQACKHVMVRSAECGVQRYWRTEPLTIFLSMPLALASEGQGARDKGHGI
jgi:hypothetical protein